VRLLDVGTVTADDVRAAVPLPPGLSPKLFRAVPGPLAEEGIIRGGDFVKTSRPEGHARPIQVWVLADRQAALDWFRDHPDIPDLAAEPPLQLTLF
jgi:hypothetical protein